MNRFFVYEEYCAVHELMTKDVASADRMMPGWPSYQKGLEVLASSLGPVMNRDSRSKKAGTIRDLLIKVTISSLLMVAVADCTANPTFVQISSSVVGFAEEHSGD